MAYTALSENYILSKSFRTTTLVYEIKSQIFYHFIYCMNPGNVNLSHNPEVSVSFTFHPSLMSTYIPSAVPFWVVVVMGFVLLRVVV